MLGPVHSRAYYTVCAQPAQQHEKRSNGVRPFCYFRCCRRDLWQ